MSTEIILFPEGRSSRYRPACRRAGRPRRRLRERPAGEFTAPTVKQHLAVLRMLFDRLVTSLIMNVNPGHSIHRNGYAGHVDSSLQAMFKI
jgi:hypothetical protein